LFSQNLNSKTSTPGKSKPNSNLDISSITQRLENHNKNIRKSKGEKETFLFE
jgi:hypothetical protein